ncbi:MAG: hypothetical protein P4L68_09100 [Methylovirgula sp.]|nr:hypothetical protein [Methylovirgula sp.]
MHQWGTNIDFGNGEDFRGAAGGRLGMSLPTIFGGHVVEAWILGRVWDEFLNNGNTVDLVDNTLVNDNFGHIYGEVKGGLTVVTLGSGWAGFVDGGVKFNNLYNTVTAKAGVDYTW